MYIYGTLLYIYTCICRPHSCEMAALSGYREEPLGTPWLLRLETKSSSVEYMSHGQNSLNQGHIQGSERFCCFSLLKGDIDRAPLKGI